MLRCGTLLLLALAAYWTARLAWADHLSRSSQLSDRRRAVQWSPRDAEIRGRLASGLEAAGEDALPALRAAAALDPENPQWRMDLGLREEIAGDLSSAADSLLAAARLSRLYQPRYLLAGYYFRRENADLCIRWSRAALSTAPADAAPVLNLLGRLLDPAALAAESLRQPPALGRQFLSFLGSRGPADAADKVALRLAQNAVNEDLPAILGYANLLLADGRAADAADLWNALCKRGLLPYEPLDAAAGRSLTDSGFHYAPLGSGFGWHDEGAPGLRAVRFEDLLRAEFSGDQRDDCVVVWQYVALVPGARYRLHFAVQADDPAAAQGLIWRLFYYPGRDGPWGPVDGDLTAGFRAPTAAARLTLIYRRLPGTTRLTGPFSVSGLRLERLP